MSPLYAIPLVFESYADDEAGAITEANEFAELHADIAYIGSPVEVTTEPDDDRRYIATVAATTRVHRVKE